MHIQACKHGLNGIFIALLGTTTGAATSAGAAFLMACSADTEARVPKARTTKEAISVKENVMGCVDLEV